MNGQPTPSENAPEAWNEILAPLRPTTPPAAAMAEMLRRLPEHVCTGRMPGLRAGVSTRRDLRGNPVTAPEVLSAILRLATWTRIMRAGSHRPLSRPAHGLWASARDLALVHGGDVAREIFLLQIAAEDGAVKIRIVDGEPLFAADLSYVVT